MTDCARLLFQAFRRYDQVSRLHYPVIDNAPQGQNGGYENQHHCEGKWRHCLACESRMRENQNARMT